MTDMQSALKASGVKVPPQNERVWNWLKDHPRKTGNETAVAVRLTKASVAGMLSDMCARGMLSFTIEPSSPHKARRYSTIGQKFELLPRSRNGKGARPISVLGIAPEPAPAPVVKPKFDVDSMTLADARELYAYLQTVFGGKS